MTESQVEQTQQTQHSQQSQYGERYASYDYDPTYYDPGEIDSDVGRLRPQETDERTSWVYLGVLCAVFLGLIASARACEALDEDSAASEVVIDDTGVSITNPVRLAVEVEGDIVTLRGAVPDEEARSQLLAIVEASYDPANLIDELTIDPETTLDGGSIAVTGVTAEDDERPDQISDAIVETFELEDGGVTVERSEEGALLAVSVDGFTENGTVRFSGAVPDQAAIDELAAAGQAAWGTNSVDVGGLSIDERTWTGGEIRISGTVPPGNTNHETFATEILDRLGDVVTVDVAAVTTDLSAETLATIEAQIQEAVTANPILFAPESSELDPAGDAVLTVIVQQLTDIPDVRVEVVGHTDDQGSDDENLILSQERAEAVKVRLVELGIDEARLNARGEGEQFPLVDEETPEARAQNRRIEFNLISD